MGDIVAVLVFYSVISWVNLSLLTKLSIPDRGCVFEQSWNRPSLHVS